ncbi:glucose 1-dehydrogenase [Aetokthonos hydrillicola Thurmond2011]|jgi:glucose 1-dehydrogenase|uniref:Glucose 1-dehydrogenase n=1 Tax=Aetokthonos hydrillicola Thurmond2011 TaxID=2712845 RepID=A0AAP5M8E4_9CYAN|nr:glucose 1-dehydrogenase [Aetokthonos hydrillicola]MBO3459416.1 glucose 1-dehydrogenase [Aetokthonos hydrillicola CCALA 1050]MBW4586562.1 glucose 1-dehydrogenase [Aetokthonos hydrillicola CCALA 1050]MDR9893493.1 glucose 1-dehydrogenase [Aetokthonos hydrillicola Thurmond2011]
MKKLEGKVALVTGSSSGIGQAIGVRLASEGADVVIDYRSHPEGAKETLAKVEAFGGKGLIVKADLSVISDIHQLIAFGIEHFGKLDILVNNAGIDGKNADFWNITEADYDAVLNLNLKGTFFATQAMVQHLIEAKRPGKIINISSTHEEMAFPHFTSYCASKGGVKMMMRNLAVELGPLGITINNVAPGAIETPINTKLLNDPQKLAGVLKNIPLGRLGKPEDIAPIVAFLASSDADYITGATFYVDGGLSRNYHEQ